MTKDSTSSPEKWSDAEVRRMIAEPNLSDAGRERVKQVTEALAAQKKEQKVVAYAQTAVRGSERVGRNQPCPCGSGKKFKKCCIGEPYVAYRVYHKYRDEPVTSSRSSGRSNRVGRHRS
jgi:hypothetical protein